MKVTLRPTQGHILDIDASELNDVFLSRAHNVHTRKGFPTRVNGRRTAYGTVGGRIPTDALHLQNFTLNGLNWWLALGRTAAYAVEGSNAYIVTAASMGTVSDTEEWTSTLLNGIPVLTNAKTAPLYWDGNPAHILLPIPGWPAGTVARVIIAFRYHLFALNIDGPSGVFENLILHSDAADPGTLPTSWTPSASNEAGSLTLTDTPGRCVAGARLGAQLLVYKPASCYAIDYQGQQPDLIYTQRLLSQSVGAMGPHCIGEVGKGSRHIIMGNDDVVLTDGVGLQSIADNRIKYALANTIDEQHAANSFVVRDLNRRELWCCVPESGSQYATIAHIFDEARETWVTRDLNAVRYGTTGYVTDTTPNETWDADSETWDEDTTLWNEGSVGSIARVVLSEDSTVYVEDTRDATLRTAYIRREDLSFDDDVQQKLTQRVWIRGTGAGFAALEFRLGVRDDIAEPITWGSYAAVTPTHGVPYETCGRYISIEVRGITEEIWSVDRILIEARANGPF